MLRLFCDLLFCGACLFGLGLLLVNIRDYAATPKQQFFVLTENYRNVKYACNPTDLSEMSRMVEGCIAVTRRNSAQEDCRIFAIKQYCSAI